MAASPATDGPTTSNRHRFVDALRGFALLGILLVNIEYLVQPIELGWHGYDSGVDQVVRWLVVAFGQTKIYPLFALLFGYGISLQMENAKRRGTELWPRYRRRMLGIVVLGLAHGLLFFPGDILVIYAAVGAGAFRFRSWETARLLRLAAIVYGVATIIWLVVGLLDLTTSPAAPTASADLVEAMTDGSFVDVVVARFWPWLVTAGILAVIQGPAVFAFFLAGIALGRTDRLSDPGRHRAEAFRVLHWSPLAIAGAAIGATMTVVGGRWDTLGFAIGFAAAPLLAAAYVAVLSLVLTSSDANSLSSRSSAVLEASGRVSLSAYLLQSIVVSTLSFGYGFGLFGRVGPLAGVALAVAVWAALSAAAVAWMRVARFGPFEWVLRSFTYQRRQPMWRSTVARAR